jgi:CheY-like chemotaxis protein
VAKILVADDNSNIQRMVGLALKDQGIEVVAVGNGEAAVRKISELRPDLVLADVFMPVRNGYEVCEYVKKDTSLAHIPVILLVGAFDPLDEQEAQRVGADGVLKKPFVPPDPLIAMVKAALQRAGISLGPATPEKSAAPPPRKAADLLPRTPTPPPPTPVSPLAGVSFSTPPAPAAPTASSGSSGGPAPFAPVIGDESFVDEPPRPEPVKIDAAKHTLAFGNLLEPTTEEAAEDTENVKAADWRALDEPDDVPEEEEEEVKESAPSWRRDGGEGAFVSEDGSGPVKDWRESAEIQSAGRQSARETWDEGEEKGGFVTAAEVPTEMGAFASELSALEVESRTVEAPGASTPEMGVPDVQTEAASTRAETELPAIELADTAATEEVPAQVNGDFSGGTHAGQAAEPVHQSAMEAAPEVAASETVNPASGVAANEQPTENAAQEHREVVERHDEKAPESSVVNSWFSRPTSPWDTDAQKMNPLAASWDAGKAATSGNVAPDAATEQGHNEPSHETAGHDARSNDSQVSLDEAAVVSDDLHGHEAGSHAEQSAAWHEAEMDALVAKVLAKMNPEVLQTLMREILKPVVTAIVEDELRVKR